MLRDISISGLAIIDHLEIEFDGALNLLTGETGAGKSIIVDALGFVLGARGSADLIKTGAEEVVVEAVFCGARTPEIVRIAEEAGFEFHDELILRRRLNAKGVNRAHVNDSTVNISTLRQLGGLLVTVHGQGEGDELHYGEGQLALLDKNAGLDGAVDRVARIHEMLRRAELELERIRSDERARIRELDLLGHQIKEIEAANLDPEEEGELRKELEILRNAERLKELSSAAFQKLYDADDAAAVTIAEAAGIVEELSSYESAFTQYGSQLEEARILVEEASAALRDFFSGIEDDPGRLAQAEARLDALRSLQRKYGDSTKEVLEFLEKAKQRYAELQDADKKSEGLQGEVASLTAQYDAAASSLSESRRAAVPDFRAGVIGHLSELALEKASFHVAISPHPKSRTKSGTDRVEFLISPNPGEDLKPLSTTASGGELSRIMLAVKSSALVQENNRTVIFDEVDVGIGGRVAEFVGRKLKRIASGQQVMCITHLPQIAAYADCHLAVRKRTDGDRTTVEVRRLQGDERVEELSRMVGGEKITDVTRRHAREMLEKASEFSRRTHQ